MLDGQVTCHLSLILTIRVPKFSIPILKFDVLDYLSSPKRVKIGKKMDYFSFIRLQWPTKVMANHMIKTIIIGVASVVNLLKWKKASKPSKNVLTISFTFFAPFGTILYHFMACFKPLSTRVHKSELQ